MTLRCKFRTVWGKLNGQVDYLRTRIEDYEETWTPDMNIDELRRHGNYARMKYHQKHGRTIWGNPIPKPTKRIKSKNVR